MFRPLFLTMLAITASLTNNEPDFSSKSFS